MLELIGGITVFVILNYLLWYYDRKYYKACREFRQVIRMEVKGY